MPHNEALFDILRDEHGLNTQQNHAELFLYDKPNVKLRSTHNGLAFDAQPDLITTTSGGVPAFLLNGINPNLIKVIMAPTKIAALVDGDSKKFSWVEDTQMFNVGEYTGRVASYGDTSRDGKVGVNFNQVYRRQYRFQTHMQWGQLQLEQQGANKINYASEVSVATAKAMERYRNFTYAFGVSGLACYGLLNAPNLLAAILPTTKTAGGTTWAVATQKEIVNDVQKIVTQAITQTGQNVTIESKMRLCMSSVLQARMATVTDFNVSAMDQIKKLFPNMTIETAPEYSIAQSGEYMQLIVETLDGGWPVEMCFGEKMRMFPMEILGSFYQRKVAGSTWGTVVTQPTFIVSMYGL
jgi:hypothetical protein